MKKLLSICLLMLLNWQIKAQIAGTVAIQFYVDANNNCTYNPGEQLIYGVPFYMDYLTTSNGILSSYGGNTVTTCNAATLYLFGQISSTTNTVILNNTGGIAPNLSCGSYTNVPYNTNTVQYLPVLISGTSNLGVQANYFNYYSSMGTFTYANITSANNTISICSNIGNDSISMSFNIFNFLTCTPSGSMSPRTYSLFLDGVYYDKLITNGPFSSFSFTTGVNAMSKLTEYYYGNQTYLYLYPQLPATFTALGSHTFEVKSTQIYNNPLSTINFSCILNSIPCTKISGRFYNDCNNNCVMDASDTYGVGYFATGKIYNASGTNVTFYPNYFDGKFSIYMPTTNAYSLTQYPTYTLSPYNFTACTTGTTTIPLASTTNTFLFGYKNNLGVVVDPGVYLWRMSSTSTVISPGVGATFGVVLNNNWWNVCNASAANPGKVKVALPKFINYTGMASGPTPTFVTGASADTLVWSVPNFSTTNSWWANPFASFSVVVSATAVPATTFNIVTRITPLTDVNLSNNTYNWTRVIGGPFDPNGKITEAAGLLPNGDVPHGVQQFYYTIGFQNIGNAPAINVRTLDTIDVNFDLSTLKVLQSSFPVNVQIDNVSRLVSFNFDGINLPGVATNEPKSHGFVRYGIKLKPGVSANTVLKNRAHNYFDFNEPVPTNQTINKLIVSTFINEIGSSESKIKALPNPFNSNLSLQSEIEMTSIFVYNSMGQMVKEVKADSKELELNLSELSSGIYFISVQLNNGRTNTAKVIKL